ncbi:MAG TPA: serine/threonine-protein kinase [Candidatus Limnocylindrales bacterium]|nr:serine/threonine-protein kinase [Candidatus Limnocylindrales bacterium]
MDEIARGGMGVVYRARQLSLNRQVALKVLPGGHFANENFIKRFRREADALASLHHPNIVAIHEVGEHGGQLYFSMDLIEGSSLAERIRDNPLPLRYATQLVQRIAEAMAFAHERCLLHRDLKPSNILLDDHGMPHITDFGLAKRSDDDSDLTVTGEILGSPNYMAPEQADPELASASPASDVYSIGAILYHLLTGRPPFMAESIAQTLRLLAEGGPVSPRLLRRGLSRDLETICLKCLETDPALRYPSAKELAEELDRFHQNKPIRARPLSLVAKLGRWCRRKPALASALGVMVISLLVLAIGSPIALFRIQHERELSETARKQEIAARLRAEEAEHDGRRQLYTALVQQAHASVRSGEVGQRLQALDAIRRAAAISNSVELRREALAALALPDLRFEREWSTGPEFTLKLLAPDFDRVALCRGTGPVELRETSDWHMLATFPASTNLPAYAAWWSRDHRYLAVKRDQSPDGDRGVLEVWEIARQQRTICHEIANQAVSFHPLLPRLLTGHVGGALRIWDLEKGVQVGTLRLGRTPVRLEFSPDGARFAIATEDDGKVLVSVLDASTGAIHASHGFGESVLSLAWHPSGRWLAVADQGGTVHRMDSQTGQIGAFGSHKAQAVVVAFTPDGDYLFSGGWEREVICWDTRTLQRCLTVGLQGFTALVRADGLKCALLTTSAIKLHSFVRPDHREFLEDLGPHLRRAAFSSDGRWLAAATDKRLGVWDLRSVGPGALTDKTDSAHPSFINQGEELFAIWSSNSCCGYWRLLQGTNAGDAPIMQPIPITTQTGPVSLAFISNAIARARATGPSLLRQEGPATTQPTWIRAIQGINGISPNARWFALNQPFSPLLEVYRLPDMELVSTLRHRGNISDFAFDPAGDEVAMGSPVGVEFWSTKTWTQTRVLTNFTDVLFTPEHSTRWLTTDHRTAGLYDADTLQPLLPLPPGILPLALSGNGRLLAVSVDLRYLQIWDLAHVRRHLRELGLDWQS